MRSATQDSWLTQAALAGIVVVVILAGGSASAPVTAGPGNATVEVIGPEPDTLHVTPGRFGTRASYLRLPDIAATVRNVSGRPLVQYRIRVPSLGIDRHRSTIVRSSGRVRLHLSDVAFPPESGPQAGSATAWLSVHLRSFSTDRVVVNRSIPVRVSR